VLRLSCRALVIVAASLACAGKLRGHGAVPPVVATQEVNRCLSVVRAAARRSTPRDDAQSRPEANMRLVPGHFANFPLDGQSS
jgi:hypothetical protein